MVCESACVEFSMTRSLLHVLGPVVVMHRETNCSLRTNMCWPCAISDLLVVQTAAIGYGVAAREQA
jgi:hypothetical protein